MSDTRQEDEAFAAHNLEVLIPGKDNEGSDNENTGMINEKTGAVRASLEGDYHAHWLRDGLYVLKGLEYAIGAKMDIIEPAKHVSLVQRMVNVPTTILKKYEGKLHEGIRKNPHVDEKHNFLHARYDLKTFDEITHLWGHNQLDMFGLYLFELADLSKKEFTTISSNDDIIVINKLTRYLETLRWWECPDFGMWEEGPDLHSSSVGSVLGGLKRLKSLDNPDLLFNEAQLEWGRESLDKLLPRESISEHGSNRNRAFDLSQLSLIWPYRVATPEQTTQILDNIETHLVGDHGVKRYLHDAYYNGDDERMYTEPHGRTGLEIVNYSEHDRTSFHTTTKGAEAEWPLGFAWLSIVHSKLAKRAFEKGEDGTKAYQSHKEKARTYLDKLKGTAVVSNGNGQSYIPELYSRGIPNANTPLTWTASFAVVAVRSFYNIEDTNVPVFKE